MGRIGDLLQSLSCVRETQREVLDAMRGPSSGQKVSTILGILRTRPWPWISTSGPGTRAIHRRIWDPQAKPLHERVPCILQRWASLRAALSIFIVWALIAFLIGRLTSSFSSATTPSTLPSVAQVLGVVAGILIAVVIFGVQFHGEQLGRAAPLTPYFVARQGIFLFASMLFSLVTTNVVLGLLAEGPDSPMVFGLFVVDCIGALVINITILLLLY